MAKDNSISLAHGLQLPEGLLEALTEQIMAKVRDELTAKSIYVTALQRLADGRSIEQQVEVNGDAEQTLIELLRAQGATAKTVPAIDVKGMLESR